MPHTLTVDMLGAAIGIDLSGLDAPHQQEARDAWADALAADGLAPITTVAPDAHLDGPHALEQLSQRVTLAGIAAHRGTMWMLHAAGVADEDGRVLVFVGPSGRGKTTASIALGQEFGYVSDETIGILADGTVRAYRKPLSIIEHPGRPKVQRAPSLLGARPLPEAPLRLAGIVLLDRRADGPEEPDVHDVSFVDAIEDLVPQSSSLVAMDAPLQFIANRIGETGGLRRVTYREAAALARVVSRLFEESVAPVEIARAPVVTTQSIENAVSAVTYSRAAVVDAVEAADGTAVIVLQRDGDGTAGVVHTLTGIAPALWCAANGATVERLTEAAVAAYGQPEAGGAELLVGEALREIVAVGLLEQR